MLPSFRISIISVFYVFTVFAIGLKLFHWQVIASDKLSVAASSQRNNIASINPVRGSILASDGFPLAINHEGYQVFANPQKIDQSPQVLASVLAPYLAPSLLEVKVATDASEKEIEELKDNLVTQTSNFISDQLSKKDLVWVLLKRRISHDIKDILVKLDINGLGFEQVPYRLYPEASMAAQVLGFVGMDDLGKEMGYFGLEAFYDMELTGRPGIIKQERDALNRPIPIGKFWTQSKRDGRHIQLLLNRGIQYLVEQELREAIKRFDARSGAVAIMDPKTGGIMAMASWPEFEPSFYTKYDYEQFINPLVSQSYEPGSTFKVLTMAAAIDAGVIKPDTRCDICDAPFKIDKYSIRTWNNKYYPNSTMTEVLAHSDNVGMVFVARKLGEEKFKEYIEKFGIGMRTNIDLQGEIAPKMREKWIDLDLYTAAFGQGISVTGIQMLKAVGAVANNGIPVQPRLVQKIIDNERERSVPTNEYERVISERTAETVKDMMVASVEYGDAHWARPKGYKIAGKTGTAQVAIGGHYDEEKTIASFVGFAPADDPKFIMLTIIEEPKSSQWGSETAAPLFFDISRKLFMYMGIPESK